VLHLIIRKVNALTKVSKHVNIEQDLVPYLPVAMILANNIATEPALMHQAYRTNVDSYTVQNHKRTETQRIHMQRFELYITPILRKYTLAFTTFLGLGTGLRSLLSF